MTTTAAEPTVLTTPPPVRRDRMVHTYLAAIFGSACGDTVFTVGLAWTAVHLLSPAVAGLVVAIELLPQAMCTLAGGVIADRHDTRAVLALGAAARVGVLLLASGAWLAGLHGATVLFTVAVAFGVVAGLSNPAGATLVRQLVLPTSLITVSGWSQTGLRVARLLGAPAGALVVQWGFAVSMLIDALSFLGLLLVVRCVVHPRLRLPRVDGEPWRAALRDGLGFVCRTPVARALIGGIAALNVFVSPVLSIGVALRVAESDWGAGWLGAAEATFAAGAIAGSVLAIRHQPAHLPRRSFAVLILQGVGMTLSCVPSRAAVIVAMATIGVTAGLASVWISGSVQRVIPAGVLGRVSSVSQLGDLLLIPVATPVFGLIAAGWSVSAAAGCFGVGMAALCAFVATRRTIRELR